MPGKHASVRNQEVDALVSSGILYTTDSGTVLAVKASNAPGAAIGTSTLPTRITSATATVLTALEELVDKGVLDAKALHSRDPGVTMETI
jgi:hypothetical protein